MAWRTKKDLPGIPAGTVTLCDLMVNRGPKVVTVYHVDGMEAHPDFFEKLPDHPAPAQIERYGYELTGEFRVPKIDERGWVGCHILTCLVDDTSREWWILRKLPSKEPVIERCEVYVNAYGCVSFNRGSGAWDLVEARNFPEFICYEYAGCGKSIHPRLNKAGQVALTPVAVMFRKEG